MRVLRPCSEEPARRGRGGDHDGGQGDEGEAGGEAGQPPPPLHEQ